MTVWRKGMQAAVVRNNWLYEGGAIVPNPPEIGDVFRVRGVQWRRPQESGLFKRLLGKKTHFLQIFEFGWVESSAFRPVVEDKSDTALIERIKACKPARIPLPAQHPTGADPARWPLPAGGETSQCVGPFRRPFHDAGGHAPSSHGVPATTSQRPGQGACESAFENGSVCSHEVPNG